MSRSRHVAKDTDTPCYAGPFIKLGPLRNVGEGVAERAGCLSAAGLVVILTVALTIYGAAAFQAGETSLGVKTLSGRELQRDPLQVTPALIVLALKYCCCCLFSCWQKGCAAC